MTTEKFNLLVLDGRIFGFRQVISRVFGVDKNDAAICLKLSPFNKNFKCGTSKKNDALVAEDSPIFDYDDFLLLACVSAYVLQQDRFGVDPIGIIKYKFPSYSRVQTCWKICRCLARSSSIWRRFSSASFWRFSNAIWALSAFVKNFGLDNSSSFAFFASIISSSDNGVTASFFSSSFSSKTWFCGRWALPYQRLMHFPTPKWLYGIRFSKSL